MPPVDRTNPKLSESSDSYNVVEFMREFADDRTLFFPVKGYLPAT
jgi:hypothetical protein